MKHLLYALAVIYFTFTQVFSQTINWTGYPAGGTSYSSGIMTATITSASPGFQNGTPRHYAGSTVGNGQCGIAGGLALEHMFGNITNAHSTLKMDFTSGNTTNGLCGNISFRIKDINSDESNQMFADWVEISALDGNNNPVPVANIVASGGSNKVNTTSGNVRIIKGHSNSSYGSRNTTTCDDVTFTITPAVGTTLRTVTLKYHPDYTPSPNNYYNFMSPLRPAFQYISISPITINAAAGPTDVLLTATPASCNDNNGTVTIGSVTGGTSPYQFNFNNQGLSGATFFDNLSGGNYNVIVVDNNGCSHNASVNVSTQPGPTAIATISDPASCGAPDGEVVLGTVTGGTAPYQYNFNNQGFSSTTTYSNLSGGTYSVVVRDNNGCTYTTSITVGSSNAPTAIAITSDPASCGTPDGEVTLGTVTGGTAPYQYNFNNQGFSSTTTYSNLSGGTYSVVVRDNNGCTYTTSITVGSSNVPTAIAITSDPASCETPDGEVTLGTVTGGTAPYQYNFNNQGFSSTTTYSNLAGGTYSVIVRDNNGCTYTTSVIVGSSNAPTAIAITSDPASCGTPDGEVVLGTVTGGTAPYQYNFNNQGFSSTTTYSNLSGGTYSVVVRDNNGCMYTTSVTVGSSNAPTGITFTSNPASCGASDGEVTLGTVTGGTTPYQYNFNNQGFSPTTTYSNLAGGTYSVVVRDNNGCKYTTSVTVGSSNAPTAIAITFDPASCGAADGEVVLGTVTGGTAPYQYNFNNQGFLSTTTYSNLAGGTYSVIVRDNNGCTYTTSVTVGSSNAPTGITFTSNPASCGTPPDGEIILGTVTGGAAPYQYNFNNQGFSSTTTYSNLAGGTYSVVIRDNNGCTYTTSVNVSSSNAPTAIAITSNPSSCGTPDGEVTLGTVTGGTAPYQYNFNNQGFSSTTTYSNLSGGTYSVVVRDNNGCTYTTSVNVNDIESPPTNIDYTITAGNCEENGSFIVTDVYGGTAPYIFSHNGIITGDTIIAPSGSYSLVITDVNGCQLDTVLFMPEGTGEERIHIPNVFTPNGDLVNDTWFISGTCIVSLECIIVNRWGELMYQLNSITDEWNGKTNGNKASEGVYFYKAKVTYHSGKTEDFHGHITLVDK